MTTNRPYVLWRRVSTKEQSDSGLGLEAQRSIAKYFMKVDPVVEFTDVYSGTKLSECRNLCRAIKLCKESGYLLVIAKTDRFRNVVEALQVLDAVGEGNLCFCDIPTTDRTVLTMVFAMWERQAIMGRINTKIALNERKTLLAKKGYFISKAGKRCTHLGNKKGDKQATKAAIEASAVARTDAAIKWKEQSSAVAFAIRRRSEGWTLQQIVDEISTLYDKEQSKINSVLENEAQVNIWGSPTGKKPSRGTISRWLRDSNPLML